MNPTCKNFYILSVYFMHELDFYAEKIDKLFSKQNVESLWDDDRLAWP